MLATYTISLCLTGFNVLRHVSGYSEGAPDSSCLSLQPEHLSPAQTGASPFELILGTKEIEFSDAPPIINFTLKGLQGEKFKGFMIQARIGKQTVGTFEPEPIDYIMMDCPGDREFIDEEGLQVWLDKIVHTEPGKNTASHYKADSKESMTFYWKPPSNMTGDIFFHYTVVKDFDTYWIDQRSEPFRILNAKRRK